MSEPLTIWECPHGHREMRVDTSEGGLRCAVTTCSAPIATNHMYFAEEDVRPLWEAARDARTLGTWTSEERCAFFNILDAFPTPEDWR